MNFAGESTAVADKHSWRGARAVPPRAKQLERWVRILRLGSITATRTRGPHYGARNVCSHASCSPCVAVVPPFCVRARGSAPHRMRRKGGGGAFFGRVRNADFELLCD